MVEEQYPTLRETSRFLKVSASKLKRLVRQNRIPSYEISHGRLPDKIMITVQANCKIGLTLTIPFLVLLCLTFLPNSSWAWSEEDCRSCHGNSLAERHHTEKLKSEYGCGYCHPYSKTKQDCLVCHNVNPGEVHNAGVTIRKAWVTDENNTEKDTFSPGDPIRYHTRYKVTKGWGGTYRAIGRVRVNGAFADSLRKARKCDPGTYKLRLDGRVPDNADFGNASITFTIKLKEVGALDILDTAKKRATIIVSPPNRLPIADAGTDQTTPGGAQVTLDGSGSSDPDKNYPLSYAWNITGKPQGSMAELSGADTVHPTLTPGLLGEYTVQLIVADSLGAKSEPDKVRLSTENSAPVADAGPDQAIIEIGTVVELNGTQSYDGNGDAISFSWAIITKPAESLAILSNSTSPTATFVADVHGDYVIELLVRDPWVSSEADRVVVSLGNVKPVANAGVNQSVVQGDTVYLDGSRSYDANLDTLTYSWNIVSRPEQSLAEISYPASVQTSFIADLPGTYVVSLVVADDFVDSDPSNVTMVAISYQDVLTQILQKGTRTINGLDSSVFKNQTMRNALTNKINAVLEKVDQGFYDDALGQLEQDILEKTNGCADKDSPDENDWIKDCDAQNEVYSLIMRAIELMTNLIDDEAALTSRIPGARVSEIEVDDDEIEAEVVPPPGYVLCDILGAEITSMNGKSTSIPGMIDDYCDDEDDALEVEFKLPEEIDEDDALEVCAKLKLASSKFGVMTHS
jgi:hypothetical protein